MMYELTQSAEMVSAIPTDRRSVEVVLLNNCTIRFIVEVCSLSCTIYIAPYHSYMLADVNLP